MEETLLRFLLLLLLLHSLLVSASMASHAPFSLQRDAKALITFSKTIENDPNGVFQNWSSHNPCFWTGINCFEQRVVSLNLSNSGLMGFLRLDLLMAMKNLRYVFLQGNKFYGNLSSIKSPSSCSFVVVDLSHNNFTANIPADFLLPCTQLLTLNLSHNLISGGVYPYSPSVQVLDLSDNQFSDHGLLNYSFSNCMNLVNLDLSFNNFTGTVPRSLSSCTNLELLDLSANGFSGTIPSGICPSLSKLQKIYIADNYITGSLPSELGHCKKLKIIGFSFNLLSGPVPPEILSLPQLTDLNLCANNINGVIPETVCKNSQNLQTLILNNNFITGTIPSNLANCTNLGWLSLANNRLTGPIPPSIGTLNKLEFIQLSNNSLTGNIPPELGNCRNLIYLDLNSNNLTGSLPPELTKQTGKIIAGFMNGKQTAFLYNEGGMACRGVGQLFFFAGIRLDRLKSYSTLTDCPPTQIFTSTDRPNIYHFKNDGSMYLIDVSYNSLSGTIDPSFGAMPYLDSLQLSHNGFTGTIPESFGGLKLIFVLDLSHNQLHGHIPNSLGSLSTLTAFDVSNNKLSGKIPPQDRLRAFPAKAYENNSGLCGFPLPDCSSYSGGVAGGEPSSSKSTGGSSFAWKEVPFAMGAVIGTAVSLFIQIKFCRKYMGFAVGVVVEIAVCLSIITGLIFAFLK